MVSQSERNVISFKTEVRFSLKTIQIEIKCMQHISFALEMYTLSSVMGNAQ